MKRLLVSILLAVTCSCTNGGFQSKSVSSGLSSTGAIGSTTPVAPTDFLPSGDRLDAQCAANAAFDSCVFLKNPVAQKGGALSAAEIQNPKSLQLFGIHLVDLDGSGFLQNSSIRVQTLKSGRLPVADKVRIKAALKSPGSDLAQVMAYYYANQAIRFFSARGPLGLKNSGLEIVVDDGLSGWRSSTKTIHLGSSANGLALALDASQVLYLLGMANADLASGGKLSNLLTDTNHTSCGTDARGCCASAKGCSRALLSGAAFYFVAAAFSNRPILGELEVNATSGVRLCNSINRSLLTNQNQTISAAYGICPSRKGDVHILGDVYANIWWEIRQKSNDELAIDGLYLAHLAQLQSSDDFTSIKTKILSLDQQMSAGRFAQIIQSAFNSRGI